MIRLNNEFYVYIWTRLDTNEVFYVGKGHKNRYKDMRMRNKYFLHIINKVGKDNTKIDIIENNLTEEEAFEREKYYISYYRDISSCLTNMTDGGDGSTGWYKYLTEEEKERHKKKSKSFLGKHHTEETKKKMSESMKGSHTISESGKRILSELHNKPVVVLINGYLVEEYKSVSECQSYYSTLGEHSLSKSCIMSVLKDDGYIHSKYKKHKIHKNKRFIYKEDYDLLISQSTIETISSGFADENNGVEYHEDEISSVAL